MTNPMTPHLEKIARAIYEDGARNSATPSRWPTWENAGPTYRAEGLSLARAALSALLPPSEEMVEAMGPQITFDADVAINGDWRAEVRSAFTAAIQSILSEGEGT